MDVPVIKSERLRLRPFRVEDADDFFEILSAPEMLKYFPGSGSVSREGVSRMIRGMIAHWREHDHGLWAVESEETGQLLGRCGLQTLPETEEVEIDFIIGRPYWGCGYATEAGLAAVNYGFVDLALTEIVGIVHRDNSASQRVLEKIGMSDRREATYFGMDVYRYEIRNS